MNTQINRQWHPIKWIAPMVGILVMAVAIPAFAKGFLLFQATQVMIFAIAIMGLNILVGFSGQLSLGHGAFYAVGAYSAAILMGQYDLHYGFALLAAGVITFLFGFMFGLPALRLEGHYLAMATFS